MVQVVAHRGASDEHAEHTLTAYTQAIDDGADALECDVRLTRDGVLICVHDRRVDRTSDGRGVVSTLELAELRDLDFGSWRDNQDLLSDPITMASDKNELPVGTVVYYLNRYFVMEDDCASCIQEWSESKRPHLDLYAGNSTDPAVLDCEVELTPAGQVIVELSPPPGRPSRPFG